MRTHPTRLQHTADFAHHRGPPGDGGLAAMQTRQRQRWLAGPLFLVLLTLGLTPSAAATRVPGADSRPPATAGDLSSPVPAGELSTGGEMTGPEKFTPGDPWYAPGSFVDDPTYIDNPDEATPWHSAIANILALLLLFAAYRTWRAGILLFADLRRNH